MKEEMSLLKHPQEGGDINRHEPTENFYLMHDDHSVQDMEHRQQSRHYGKFLPMQVHLMVQFNDGTTREWGPIASMNEVVQTLRAVMMGSLGDNRQNNGPIRVFDQDSVAVSVDADLHDVTAQKVPQMHPPVSFFWIDITGSPEPKDLNVLFGLLKVNARTQRRWGVEATGGPAGDSLHCTNGSVFEDDSDPFWGSNEEKGGREPDEMHVFVEEQYVQLQIAVIRASSPPCAHDTTQSMYAASRKEHATHQPDRLHANLFDVDVEEDLGRVELLCFSDGIVTWRPVPRWKGGGTLRKPWSAALPTPLPQNECSQPRSCST
ncbi:putative CorA-like Mg2+ transporter protein [Trypanosoma cruzi]|uniref:Putative CorA-like Mg2+ transporter protein n=1 Tax=Trypanosoma cruzi TaxID=5693 RepID=A0A2V2V5I3_TRYCR|nr:putative CorA-like Mg2+ transporter protein [Trypanosoma cruzi]